MTRPNEATLAQIRAADPFVSTWVTANAGSGKTRVLTDRVARLLLRKVPPQRILCLTYTKAAASHMQNQLFARLGAWAMLPDHELSSRLAELGEDLAGFSQDDLRNARTLFARALETPGGLKIQTIHSFCSALLRQFPLEAGVSPRFQEIDDRNGKRLRADVLDAIAGAPDHTAFDAMARHFSGSDLHSFVREISKNRDAFSASNQTADIGAAFGLPKGFTSTTYLENVLPEWAGDVLNDLQKVLMTGKATDQKNAGILASLDLQNPTLATAIELEKMFVFGPTTKSPNEAKFKSFPTKDIRLSHLDLMDAVDDLMLRFQDQKPNRLALAGAQKAVALHAFANVFLPEYDRMKSLHGWLDFDDLILKARNLLTDSNMAQWVLFKLDGGIDHILVDEAQDTSPEQWAVIACLAEEFSTGQGARDVERTLFVVGDEKQSIYSFQGADPAVFAKMRQHFDNRLAEAQTQLVKRDLLFSFRSSAAILRVVDAVVQNDALGGLPENVMHRAFHSEFPGRVDLWPFVEKPEKAEQNQWFEPIDMPLPNDPALVLAANIALEIKGILERKETIPTTRGSRRIRAGDFLILVQSRSDIFHEIIKALKEKKLPVAGADRLKIGGELAVRDLTSLLAFMTLPEDDLSLAEALRSPLFDFSEAQLFDLAHGRKGFLWPALRNRSDDHGAAVDLLNDLLKQADYLRPYDVLERILTRHNGRENLIARLGKEAEEGIDALLDQALQYEQLEAPSLPGFLSWMDTDESDVKRQMDGETDEIRVMTVHGAKGLESPIVILPDTAKRKPPNAGEIVKLESGLAAWKLKKEHCPDPLREALEGQELFQQQERMRLLYVAMTRAENWLIVCGGGNQGEDGESWYNMTKAAMTELATVNVSETGQDILRYETYDWHQEQMVQEDHSQRQISSLPEWIREPAPTIATSPKRLNPSDLGGNKVVDESPDKTNEAAALSRGLAVHTLLEHLPKYDESEWRELTHSLLEGTLGSAEQKSALQEVSVVLNAPDLGDIFARDTLAEISVTADVNGLKMDGVIDRLLVSDTHVLAVDFKSNAVVPARTADIPEGLLRQMGAYACALKQIYPDRTIETAILWTKTATLMRIEHAHVTEALTRAAIS